MVVSPRRSLLPEPVEQYLTASCRAELPVLTRLREETATLPQAGMQIGVDQAALLQLLIRLIGARKVLEIGTFTGLSSLAMAMALPADGRVITCDISDEWTRTARRFWAEAGQGSKIELRLAPALDTLGSLEAAGERFGFVFIDGDKPNYERYYEFALRLVDPGGLIALDNMLWSGKVADPGNQEENTVVIRDLNRKIRDDARVDSVLLSVGDGIMLASPRLR